MIEKRSYYYFLSSSSLYYYYCFRRIFNVGTYLTYIICTAAYTVPLLYYIVPALLLLLLILLLLYTFVYYIVVPTVLPIPRNLSLLFFNTNRDFSFKVVKLIVKICWWPRQSCER